MLPAGTDKANAVKQLLQDHPFFVQCGPHSVDCVRVDADEEARLGELALAESESGEHPLPDTVSSAIHAALAGTPCAAKFAVYRVTDVVHTLPAGLWDSRVVSTYEMTDTPAGVYVRVRSPMSIVMDTVWTVSEPHAETGELELVEEIVIYCSRLLIGTVKGLCDSGWQQIHAKMTARLEQDQEAKA